MLVVDNNKMKLLKMKEKLLEVSSDNYQENLDDYKKLATEIDLQAYASLVNHIKETNYHDLPLEEQINVLSDFVREYDDVNELQCSFRNVYQKYAGSILELSDISNILIDEIKERISTIEGCLLNNNNIENNKKELEKLNLELIDEEKRHSDAVALFKNKENQLRNSFINAEGRISNSSDPYISFMREFSDFSLDLKQLMLDKEILDSELDKALTEKSTIGEEFDAAGVCYNYLPTIENKKTYSEIALKLVNAEYKFALLQMANLISKDFYEYESVKLKRERLKIFNTIRLDNLRRLGITLLIDPFSQLKIDEQLEIIESYGDNKERISVIRRNIGNVNTLLESRMKKNTEFMVSLNAIPKFIKDSTTFSNVKDEAITKVNDLEYNEEYLNEDIVPENKVTKVASLKDDFMLDRAKEKMESVIKRVNQLYAKPEKNTDKLLTPDLLVLPSQVNLPKEEEIFHDEIEITTNKEEEKPILDDLFQEVKPFNEAALFDNKYEDIFNDQSDNVMIDTPSVSPKEEIVLEEPKEEIIEPKIDDSFWTIIEDMPEEEQKTRKRAA